MSLHSAGGHYEPRCTVLLPTADVHLRCQLKDGHEGKHLAVAAAPNASQRLWRWATNFDAVQEPFQRDLFSDEAWADGMPEPEDGVA